MQVKRPFEIIVHEALPNLVKDKRNADTICYVYYYILKQPTKDKRIIENMKGFAPINKEKLKNIIGCNAERHITFLLNNGFLERDNNYIPTKKSYYYRAKQGKYVSYFIGGDTPIYKQLIKKYSTKKSNYSRLPPHLYKMVKLFNSLEFDKGKAMNWINNNTDPSKAIYYHISIIKIYDKRQRYFKRNKTNKRLDTNLTNLKSELKQFIKGDFIQIDLKSSQPFFLITILKLIEQYTNYNTQGIHSPLCLHFKKLDTCFTIDNQFVKRVSKTRKNDSFCNITNCWTVDLQKFYEWVISGNLYENFAAEYKKLTGETIQRKEVKTIFFTVLFSDNSNNFTSIKKHKNIFKKVFPTVADIIAELKGKKHQQLAILLQSLESFVFIDCICKELVNANIIPLTIHDCVLIKEHQYKDALCIIESVFECLFGFIPCLSIKHIKKKTNNPAKSSKKLHKFAVNFNIQSYFKTYALRANLI